ncbi:hypothetical protein R1sor_020102 [Riccia sorocarpa]|uniref:Uncharacterized protein n=1 Tax=Riccia sorocarpa TaxID=122646 RepID=A0ABD3II77_9MARC
MAPSLPGKRLPSIRLMEEDLQRQYASAGTGFLKKIVQFVSYGFKELADVDLVEFSAMSHLKMLKYVTGVQRLCVPEDIFWYAFWNTDAEGDRLLIKGTGGATCVVGWHEVAVAFGANHEESEEFRAIKINNKNFSQYRPSEFLMETVDTNAQRKLVNGQPYEEISYYKEAAPYGPTFYLMSLIAELFWCNGRSARFTTPMVYTYMRSIHGFQTNWAKVILHCLKTEIQFLQKRAQTTENLKVVLIIWAPVFLRVIYSFRETVFANTPLAGAEAWISWMHMSKDGEIDLRGLHTKFPAPIVDLKVIRESCKLTDKIPIAEPINGDSVPSQTATATLKLPARKRSRSTEDSNDKDGNSPTQRVVRTRLTPNKIHRVVNGDAGTSMARQICVSTANGGDRTQETFREFGKNLGPALGDLVVKELSASFGQLLEDANASRQLKQQLTDLTKDLKDAESSRTDLNDQVVTLMAELSRCKEEAASEAALSSSLQAKKELEQLNKELIKGTISKLESDLKKARQEVASHANEEGKLKAQVNKLTEDLQLLKVDKGKKETKLQQDMSVLQQQLLTQTSTADRYKVALHAEVKKIADLEDQVQTLIGQVDNHKFTAERAEKAQAALRSELNQVKTSLRMLQFSGNSS